MGRGGHGLGGQEIHRDGLMYELRQLLSAQPPSGTDTQRGSVQATLGDMCTRSSDISPHLQSEE